jgi:hypothetical protein
MNVVRKIGEAPMVLVLAGFLFVVGPAARTEAGEQTLTEAEIYKLESGSKDFLVDLIAAGVWKKGDDQFNLFNKYAPEARLRIPRVDAAGKPSSERDFSITGAEFRRAVISAKAYASYAKLDDDGKKRAYREFFGQETRPERSTAAYKMGLEKMKRATDILRGEPQAVAALEPVPPDATFRIIMESSVLDRDTKDLYKALHDRRLLSQADKGNLRDFGKEADTPRKFTTPARKTVAVTGHELQEHYILAHAFVNRATLAADERRALNRKLHGTPADAKTTAEIDRDIERIEKAADIIDGYADAH